VTFALVDQSRALRRTATTTLLMVAAVATLVLAALGLPGPIVDLMLERDSRAQADILRNRIVGQLGQGAATFHAAAVTPADAALLSGIPRGSEVYRLNLIAADGLVFWSSRPEDLGGHHGTDDAGAELTGGQTSYEIGSTRATEVDDLRLHSQATDRRAERMVAEIDVPVMVNGGYVGLIEMFIDLTDERAVFVGRVQAVIAAISGLAVIVGGSVMAFLARAGRRRLHDLRDRTDQERGLLADQLRMAPEVRLLGELNEPLQSSRSLDELFEMVARFMTHLLPGCEGSVYVYSNSRGVLDGCASWNGGSHKAHIHPEECCGLRRGRTYVFGDSDVDFTSNHAEPHDGQPYICFPILAHGETVGLVHLRARNDATAAEFRAGRKLAQMSAEQISLAIANVRMRDQLQDQSTR